ncbi:MAG: sulfotransferase family 2 domain-containing protein [Pseudomonadota bacterium]
MSGFRYFAIFGAMRTGSNLLEKTLDHYEGLAGLGELFNAHFIGGPKEIEAFGVTLDQRNLDPIGFLEKVIAAHPGQIPGFRIFAGHDARIMAHAATDPMCAKFVLSRDPVDSFISLNIVKETGQWMLRKEGNRKLAKIHFDGQEFEDYREGLNRHYDHVRGLIRASGQPAFEISYEDLQSLPLMNGAARYAGSVEVKDRLRQRIQRQNPEYAEDKVENPSDLAPYRLAGPAEREPRPRFIALDAMTVSRGIELTFAPIPGAGAEAVIAMIKAAERLIGADQKALVTGLKAAQLERRRARGSFVFSFVRDPAIRIWDAFQRYALRGEEQAYEDARLAMIRNYGAPGVPEMLRDPAARLRGFDAFLAFAHDNMQGRTAAPQAAAWAPQSLLLGAYSAETPPDFVGRIERLETDLRYVLTRLDLPQDADLLAAMQADLDAMPQDIALEEVLTPARHGIIRTVYERDYRRLGYPAP